MDTNNPPNIHVLRDLTQEALRLELQALQATLKATEAKLLVQECRANDAQLMIGHLKEKLAKAEASSLDAVLVRATRELPVCWQLQISVFGGEVDIWLSDPDADNLDICRDDLSAEEIIDGLCAAAKNSDR